MRALRGAFFLVALLMAAATAVGQGQPTEGEVRTWAEPGTLTIDFEQHVPKPGGGDPPRQTFTLHVEASIQCVPGTEAPVPVIVEATNGTTSWTGQSDGEPVEYFELGTEAFAFAWTPDGDGAYSIDAQVDVTVFSNATPPQRLDAEFSWLGAQGESGGDTTRCDPVNGYGWAVQGTPQTVVIPTVEGDPDPFPEPAGSNGTPVGALVPLAALGAALALARRPG